MNAEIEFSPISELFNEVNTIITEGLQSKRVEGVFYNIRVSKDMKFVLEKSKINDSRRNEIFETVELSQEMTAQIDDVVTNCVEKLIFDLERYYRNSTDDGNIIKCNNKRQLNYTQQEGFFLIKIDK